MGNTHSLYTNTNNLTDSNNIDINDSLNILVSKYIASSDSFTLYKLYDKAYCDKLLQLISTILFKNFSKDQLYELCLNIDPSNNYTTAKQFANYMASYYVKIAHLYAVIITTIYPEFQDIDIYNIIKSPNSDKIPLNALFNYDKITKCNNKTQELQTNALNLILPVPSLDTPKQINHEDEHRDEYDNHEPIFKSDVSHSSESDSSESDSDSSDSDTSESDVEQEQIKQEPLPTRHFPKIPEFIDLYCDGEYDMNTGKFLGMSEPTKQAYKTDLTIFYMELYSEPLPQDINYFNDVNLQYKGGSRQDIQKYNNNDVQLNKKEELFVQYADSLKKLVTSVHNIQTQLLLLLKQAFVLYNDPFTGEQLLSINSKLTMEKLDTLIPRARTIIFTMYSVCEDDYVDANQIYEALTESIMLNTLQNQVSELEEQRNKLITFVPK